MLCSTLVCTVLINCKLWYSMSLIKHLQKILKTFFRFLIFRYFLFICCCHHSWFQQQSYKLDWTLCYTARKFHYFLCRIRKSRSLIFVLWLQYSTTFCLLYHGRVIPKSMSMVIVLDDDLRAFNCFREQMVAMIHGVFNNSLFAKVTIFFYLFNSFEQRDFVKFLNFKVVDTAILVVQFLKCFVWGFMLHLSNISISL